MNFGKSIKAQRRNLGWTQEYLAYKMDVGERYIRKIENGEIVPTEETKKRLCKILKDVKLYIPEGSANDFGPHPYYKTDSILVTCDWHVPHVDGEFATNVLNLALSWGVETISIGGDFITCSNFARFNPPRGYNFGTEIEEAREILDIITRGFKLVIHHQGNHEIRLIDRVLQNQVEFREFARVLTDARNFVTSKFWYSEFELPEGNWISAHPETTSLFAGKIAQDLSNTKFPGRSIIVEHDHALGFVRSRNGQYWMCSSGMIGNPKKLDYYMLKANSGPIMQQGAIIVKDGIPWILTPSSNFEVLARVY